MPRPLKLGILGASTIILFKNIDKYAFMCGSNFYESDFTISNFDDISEPKLKPTVEVKPNTSANKSPTDNDPPSASR